VFVLTELLFLVITQLAGRSPMHIASPLKAVSGSLRAMLPLIPGGFKVHAQHNQ